MSKSKGEYLNEVSKLGRTYIQIPQSIEQMISIGENVEITVEKNYGGDPNKTKIDIYLSDRDESVSFTIEKNYEGDPNKIKITKTKHEAK